MLSITLFLASCFLLSCYPCFFGLLYTSFAFSKKTCNHCIAAYAFLSPALSALPATKTLQRQATHKRHIKVNQVGKRRISIPLLSLPTTGTQWLTTNKINSTQLCEYVCVCPHLLCFTSLSLHCISVMHARVTDGRKELSTFTTRWSRHSLSIYLFFLCLCWDNTWKWGFFLSSHTVTLFFSLPEWPEPFPLTSTAISFATFATIKSHDGIYCERSKVWGEAVKHKKKIYDVGSPLRGKQHRCHSRSFC